MFPLVQIGQVDFAIGINVFPSLDHHRTSGLHKADGGIVWVAVQEPQTHRNIIDIP